MGMVDSEGLEATWSKISVSLADAWRVHVPRSLFMSCSYARCLNGFTRLSMMGVKTDFFVVRTAWRIAALILCRTCFETHMKIYVEKNVQEKYQSLSKSPRM